MSKKLTNKSKGSSQGASAELQRLESMLKLMNQYGLGELELETQGSRVFARKMGATVAVHSTPSVEAQRANAVVTAAQAHLPPPADAAKKAAPVAGAENQKKILSPFVGTFYRSASPTSEPYVKEGQSVKKGQTLCIIEAMKLMNEIESDFSGKIIAVLAENGQPVEFGEPLFLIET